MVGIILSKQSLASANIKQSLLELYEFEEKGSFDGEKVYEWGNIRLYTTEERTIYLEHIDEKIKEDILVFATTHSSEAGTNSLSLHVPGNWFSADLGGDPGELCIAPAEVMKDAFHYLNALGKESGYEITMEVTHHGPLLKKTPCLFIEIGSGEKQWQDKKAGRIIADTIMKTFSSVIPKARTAVGLGGGHYAPYFNKLMLRGGFAIGHICPKYAMEHMTKKLLLQAIERTSPKATAILLDWKGLGPKKQEVVKWAEELGIEALRVRKL